MLGTDVVTCVLDDERWLERLVELHASPRAAECVRSLGIRGAQVRTDGWYGTLELSGDADERVLVQRRAVLGGYGTLGAITLIAASTQAAIESAMRIGQALWRTWRREVARVRGSDGETLEVQHVDWEEVFLPEVTVAEVRDSIRQFAVARELYDRMHLPYRRGLLFYGPPGNGKTMLCRAIVSMLSWPVVYVSPQSRAHTVDDLGAAFSEARELAPCVLWFDDIDSMFEGDATLTGFLNRLDGATAAEGLLVLATTNRPEVLDPAIVARPSRFDRIFEIGLPSASERERFLVRRFGDRLTPGVRQELVRLTTGMSMSFVQELYVGAALRALARGDVPGEQDALETHAGLIRHVRTAQRGFESSTPTGFVR